MRKKISDYSLYVFDLDGTLYDQPALRRIMAFRLIWYYFLHPLSVRELFILMYFRKIKDSCVTSDEDSIIETVAADKHTDPDKVRKTVKKWLYDDPLEVIAKTKDDALAGWMEELRRAGKTVVVLSDYPAGDKLDALGIEVDGMFGPEDERIDELKPSPKGLLVIMEEYGVLPDDVLMIGDRMEKDGMSAKAAGVDSIILPRKVTERHHNDLKG